MNYRKSKKIVFVGSNEKLLTILAKENEVEVMSSISFLENLLVWFVPDLIIYNNVKAADIEALRQNEKLLKIPVLIVSQSFAELDNLNGVTNLPKVLICNECVACTPEFISQLYKIIEHKKNILPSKTGNIIKYAILFMNKNISTKITRQVFSVQLGISEDYLTKIFRQEMGICLWNYLNIFRLDCAKKMLVKTDLPAAKISEACGFENPAYFNNAFKKYYKCTPLSVRN